MSRAPRSGRTPVKARARRVPALALAAALLGAAAADAAGTFKGTFGDVRFKAKKRVVACHYYRGLGQVVVTGVQVVQHGRQQRGATASGSASDFSARGAAFPIAVTSATATFVDGPAATPSLWAGTLDDGELTITGYRRGKVVGTLITTLPAITPTTGAPIAVNATFSVKCVTQ